MLVIGMYCLQKVNGRFIGLTWASCRLGQVAECLKNWSWGLSRKYTVYSQVVIIIVWLLC